MKTPRISPLKKIAVACGLLLLAHGVPAQTVPLSFPVYEPFQYANNEVLGTTGGSGTNWWAGNSATSSGWHINAVAALSYPGLLADTNSTPRGLISNTGTGKSRYAAFPTNTGTIYASFLLDVTNATGTADRLFFLLSSTTNSAGTPSGVWLDAANHLKISKNSSATPATNITSALVLSNTCLVVFRYKTTGSNDEVALWLNPPYFGDNANIPPPTITTTNNANASSFAGLGMYGTAATPMFFLDEIRIDNNWAGVTPPSVSPGPSFAVTGGGSGCPGDSFDVGLSGSVTTNVYLLYTNSIYSGISAAGTGSAISFGAQTMSATYSVLASNTTTAAVGWMTNAVTVSSLSPPAITTQPSPVVAATNNIAVFTVGASGTGLNYQWYRNGAALSDGGHISGSATAMLVVSPATTSDVFSGTQGYYCIITNACGASATSTTNSLTLGAPANIVWQGGNPNTNWDLATTANFTNGATPVVFNGGDNVTFDDTSSRPVVTLVGNYLAPTLITESASQNYAFTGSGTIVGAGALLMKGSGTLTISNANTFTGGTTISNGTVVLRNAGFQSVGTGPITLAGGTLDVPITGSSALGVSNEIHVVASSTLQYDQINTYACVLRGALTGDANSTLTISNNNAGATLNRVRLYTAFTNDANIVLNSLGAEMEMAPYHSSGDQIFNGVISGHGGRFVPRGGGNVILNNTNTFDDSGITSPSGYSLLLSSGNVGIGADSISTTPPAIDASPVGVGIFGINVGAEGGTCSLFSSGGAHTLLNKIVYTSATNTVTFVLGGSNNLTLAGELDLANASDSAGTNRTLQVNNTAATTLAGVIADHGISSGLVKTGNGSLYLNGANTYSGYTTNQAGLLAGSGTISGPVFVATNASLGAGSSSSIGTLTINNDLNVSGNVFVRIDKSLSPAQSNDLISVAGVLTNSGLGILTITNIGVTALAAGDSFPVFSGAISNGAALAISGGGMNWTNKLAIDGTIQALSVASAIADYPTNIGYTVSGGNVTLSWPTTHLGWILQCQTNSLNIGLLTASNAWYDVPNTGNVTGTNFLVNPINPSVFYRLRHP